MKKTNDLSSKSKEKLARNYKYWTNEEKNHLLNLVRSGLTNEQISNIIGRSIVSIIRQLQELGIRRSDFGLSRKRISSWSEEDRKDFISLWPTTSTDELAKRFGCTPRQAYSAARTFGLKRGSNQIGFRPWTDEDNEILRKLWVSPLKIEEISKELSRTVPSIKSHARNIGLTITSKKKYITLEINNKIISLLKEGKDIYEISDIISISPKSIRYRINKLNIHNFIKSNSQFRGEFPALGTGILWRAQELIDLYNNGMSEREIATHFKRTVQYIVHIINLLSKEGRLIKRNNVKTHQILSLYYAGETNETISKKLGISIERVNSAIRNAPSYRGRKKVKLTDDEMEAIGRHYNNGCTIDCITNRFGLTKNNIRNAVKSVFIDEESDNYRLIVDLHNYGLDPKQISIKTELPVRYVRKVISLMMGDN